MKREKKKAQGNVAAIIVIVIVLVILIALLIFLLFNPGVINNLTKTTGAAVSTRTVCNSPYIQVGTECCLDNNNNNICDKDEPSKTTVTITPPKSEVTCSRPYIRKGDACCLDEDYNGVCDRDEDYSYRTGETRYSIRRARVDDPFKIYNLELEGRETISIELKNKGSDDLTITNIDIDDCNSENFNKLLESGQRKTFSIDCDDRLTHINSDFEITYKIVGKNVTEIADGRIQLDIRYTDDLERDYYNDNY